MGSSESHSLLQRLRQPRSLVALVVVSSVLVIEPARSAEGDPTPPEITPTVIGTWGLNGWRISNTTVTWLVVEPDAGSWVTVTNGCDARTVTVETSGVTYTCTAKNNSNLQDSRSVTIRVDKLPPQVTLSADRPPDAGGSWFNHPLGFRVAAFDGYSGVDSCDAVPAYGGPDQVDVDRTVECRDRAGHEAMDTFTFDYDQTPPTIRAVPGRPPDRHGWYARPVRIAFAGKDAVSHVDRCSSLLYTRPNSEQASVTGSCWDRAGNQASGTHTFRFSNPLLQPREGTRVASPPLLDWVSVPRALDYNAQLWHDGRKILSRWPSASRMSVQRSWRFLGRSYRLQRGESYTWYVWPRFRSGYGRLLGSSRFVFVRPSARTVAN